MFGSPSTDFHEIFPPLLPDRPVQGRGGYFNPDNSLPNYYRKYLWISGSPGTKEDFSGGGGDISWKSVDVYRQRKDDFVTNKSCAQTQKVFKDWINTK